MSEEMKTKALYENIMIGTWAWGAGVNGSKMVFGKKYDVAVLKEAFDRANSLGLNRWDTASVYGMGSCEKMLGGFMKGRNDIFISTKYFPNKKFKSGALEKSFNDSMQRLGRKSADIFWLHQPNNLVKNLEEAIPLIKDGRIKSIGISNVTFDHVKQAEKFMEQKGLKLGAVQNHFSLLRTDQQPIVDYCNSRGIRYYAYMVLEQGALTGRYDAKNHFPAFSMRNRLFPKKNFEKIEGLLAMTKDIAKKYGIDQSQVPILWALGKGAVPIVGITKASYADKLAAALKVNLTQEEIDRLTEEAKKCGLRQAGGWESN